MTTRTRVLTLALALTLAAGCSPNPAAPAANPTSQPPMPSASASPTAAAITREAAAKQYLAIAEPVNAAIAANKKQCGGDSEFFYNGGSTNKTITQVMTNMKDCDRKLVAALRAMGSAMRAAPWPTEVKADVEALLGLNDANVFAMERLTKAGSEDEYRRLSAQIPEDDETADLLRARLGLPVRSPS